MQRELHVAAALDLELADDLDGGVVEHLQIVIVQGKYGGYHDAVAGVHAHGVHVLHAADGDGVVVGIPHDLEFDLLEALDALLHQHLVHGGELEAVGADLDQFLFVVGKPAAGAAQGERRAQHHGIADLLCSFLRFFQTIGYFGGDHRLADGLAHLLEQLPVLRPLDGRKRRAQQLHPALLQNALLFKLHGQVQARLAADAGHDGVRTLVAQDLGDVFQGQGLHVHLVRDGGVRHDGGGVGVAQYDLVALLL